jgi:diamine N-acetyltransferase
MLADQEISIRDTRREELDCICDMEQGEAQGFIIAYSFERHQAEFARPDIAYKSIWRDNQLIGFLILALDSDSRSVEFRRIVVSEPGHGYGKKVVRMVDEICRREFGRTRVWLDVFETNARARRVYEQCGYRMFGKSEHEGKTLLFYEKTA